MNESAVVFTKRDIKRLMSLNEGDIIIYQEKEYIFESYDISKIPINNINLPPILCPNNIIWDSNTYEDIRFNLMMVRTLELEEPIYLKEIMAKYKPEDLLDSCHEEVTISCSKCKNNDSTHQLDIYEAIDEFFERGWRATSVNTYCPKCSKKHLK